MTIERAVIAALTLCACGQSTLAPAQPGAAADASLFAAEPVAQWRLPNRLREISGLALTADGRLFGHDDERAVIYEIDISQGALGKAFAVGEPAETGDFEGLAITPTGEFWLATSRGRLYRFREGEDGGHVTFERFDTGLRDLCEVEGLAYLASAESLILACKSHHDRSMRDSIALYTWPIGGGDATPWRTIPEAAVTAAAGVRAFAPSSVEIDPRSGRILLLSARDGALAEFDADGGLLAARRLGAEHIQAEGMTVSAEGALVITDEGARAQALISVYERIHD